MKALTENEIELDAIETLKSLGWNYIHGLTIAPNAEFSERESFEQVVLIERLHQRLAVINPEIPESAREQAISKILNLYSPDLLSNNEEFHAFLIEKVKIPYTQDGYQRSHEVALIDFENIENNEFLVINQFTVIETGNNKRPDLILFVNGIPLVVIELKNAADEQATIAKAFEQIQTYKAMISSLFKYNEICIISDGLECKAGSLSAGLSRFMTWKSADGKKEASKYIPQLEILLKGMLNRKTLLDLVRNFIVFEKSKKEDPKTGIITIETQKKLAAFHQYYAVNKAIVTTLRAASPQPSLNPSQGEGLQELAKEGHYRGGLYFSGLVKLARELRKNQTSAEVIFWELVRNRKFLNLKFRRQHQIGNYIVDFYCHEKRLIIELDGEVHDSPEQQKHDSTRDKYLTTLGNQVIRFRNQEVLDSPENFLEKLASLLSLWERSGEGYGSRKAGVIWHTQGSGKSLSMVFYAGKIVQSLHNPTIVVITDRNDLDDQLFGTFASAKQLLRQEPVQAKSREHLKELLKVASGGIVFTTIQKFMTDGESSKYEELSDRTNIVVIADEAHRTQYGFDAEVRDLIDKETKEIIGKRIAYGFAKYMRDGLPNATYIGFTGTPIEKTDVNTPQVFGDYVDRYDIKDAVEDKATVKIYYESRLAKVNLDDEGKRLIKELDEELEEGQELTDNQKAKAKWTKAEAIIGNSERIQNLAKDIVTHFEKRQTVFEGKAMIVAMSRRIAVDLYNEIIKLKPDWHDDDKTKGAIKVIMTAASSDGVKMAHHHTNKTDRKMLSDRMKDENDPLKLVIVRDMWLTGFDVPSLHTLYVDKKMVGHNLMQAIARVNRVFKDKPGGLIVDYLGLASNLKEALSFYSDAGGKGDPTNEIEQAVDLMHEKLEVVGQMFAEISKSQFDILSEDKDAYYPNSLKFDYERFFTADAQAKMTVILQAEEHILGIQDGKNRFIREVTLLGQTFALSMPREEAIEITEQVAFFQAVKARLSKFEGIPNGKGKTNIEIETAIKQVVDEALSSDKVVDIFDAAGIEKPEISILSEEFLSEVKEMKHKNLAFELLKRLLNNEITNRAKTNLVKSKALLEMLEKAIKKYQNNLLSTAEIIQELINIAREIKEADKRGENLGLTVDEIAFYDALELNDSASNVLGDDTLREIAKEIADKVRRNATIDWTIKESARAKLMVLVRRTLTKHGYPPDKQEQAVITVLKQAELLADYFTQP